MNKKSQIDKKAKQAFLKEYEALCEKHELFVSRGPHSDDHFYVRPLDCGLPVTPRLWYEDQLVELRQVYEPE